ncbi:ATP-binding protein [Yersinia intermedia]|uniref:ATP-binding protein n=1 Tax=Yersinia intermedia TaxID=631 RepID=UPI002242CD0F|nr:ATP-binding protein [Yersinia intermedia]MCW8113976.1 ATP-binding protein [Yersinia intermedia]MDA5518792.1 ATP-binding protein [Yersinia intermedia]
MGNYRNNKKEIKLRIAEGRWQNEVKRKGMVYYEYRPKKKVDKKKTNNFIRVPTNFSIYNPDVENDFEATMKVIRQVRNIIFNPDERLYIDFSKTKNIKMASLVILFSAVEKSMLQDNVYRIVFSKDNAVNNLLRLSGFVRLCRGHQVISSFENLKYLPIVSGVGGQYREEIIDFIQNEIYKNRMKPETEHTYADAVQEAINNVSLHAYPSMEQSEKKWWMSCDLIYDQLYIAIYDEGVGIPETVMFKKWFRSTLKSKYPEIESKVLSELDSLNLSLIDKSKYRFGIVSDPIKIAISMIGDITGTSNDKHGQGSKSIKALVQNNDTGKLWIYSNHGLYKLSNGSGEKSGELVHELTSKISGTLIQWNIKVRYDD